MHEPIYHHVTICAALGYGWHLTCCCGAHARRMTRAEAEAWQDEHERLNQGVMWA